MSPESKLNLILEKLDSIESRLEKLEGKTDDIHRFTPFVGWLENQGRKIVSLSFLPWKADPIPRIENIEITEEK